MPCGVERMEMPMPPSTRGISVAPTYLRRPGLLTRFRPVMAEVRLMVLGRHLDLRELARGIDFVIRDVAFLLQDAGDLGLDLGIRRE